MRPILLFALTLLALPALADVISGVVVDLNGMPVGNASVWLSQEGGTQVTRTNDGGIYQFAQAAGGPAHLVAWREGFALGGADFDILGDIDVPIQLGEPATATLRVIDPGAQPIAGASVQELVIAETFRVPVWELVDLGFPTSRSDADGILSLANLPKGGFVSVTVHHADYSELTLPYLPVSDKRLPIQLTPGVPVRGRVTAPDGKGLAKVRVNVYRVNAAGRRDGTQRFTDAEGFYNVAVTPGEYFVDARHPDYASPLPKQTLVRDAQPVTVDATLLPPSRLKGKTVTADGKIASAVLLRYFIGDSLGAERYSRNDGSFELVVPAGEGLLRVVPPPGFVTVEKDEIPVSLNRALDVTIKPIVIKPLPVVEGRVLAPDGTPQANVVISTQNIKPPFWLLTDKEGRFTVQVAKPPEDMKAVFRAEHSQRFLRKDFEINLRETSGTIDVTLEEFEPDLSRPEFVPAHGANDLTGLLDVKAPPLSADAWFNSDSLTLEALKGKVVVLTLWAGFDTIGPTRDRMYELCALYDALQGVDDVAFVGVHDNGSEAADIQEFIKNYGIKFPVARDGETFTTFSRYETVFIPQTVLIDKAGRIRYVQLNNRLLELIKSLRREK